MPRQNILKNPGPNPFWDFWAPIILTFSLYIGIRHYIAEARYIPSGSMLPGLQVNDRLLIEKLSFLRRPPRRGEIVVFNSPYAFDRVLASRKASSKIRCALVNFPLISIVLGIRDPACDAYIKRVVAVSGDKVLVNSRGEVFLNGVLKKEPYVTNYCPSDLRGISSCKRLDLKVPDRHVLVLGDNRNNSWDGRFWPGGAFLPEDQIVGRAFWRFWPIKRLGFLVP